MARFSVPPLTRMLLGLLVFFSLSMAVIRYYLLIDSIHHHHQAEAAAASKDGAAAAGQINEPIKFSSISIPFIVMVPGMSVLKYPWVFVTASLTEDHILSFLLTGAVLLASGKYCEHMWGSTELARFIAIQTLVPNIIVLLVTVGLATYDPLCQLPSCHAAAAQHHDRLLTRMMSTVFARVSTRSNDAPLILPDRWVTINGGTAFISGFLVALKQLVPEHTVSLFRGAIRIRVARLPAIYLLIMGIYGLFLETWSRRALTAVVGFFSAWIYLRFYRISKIDPLLPFNNPGIMVPDAASGTAALSKNGHSGASSSSGQGSPSEDASALQSGAPPQSDSTQTPATTTTHTPRRRATISSLHTPSTQTVRGDASDSFALAHFFPEPLATVVALLSSVCYTVAVKARLLTPFNLMEIDDANMRAGLRGAAGTGTSPGYSYLRGGSGGGMFGGAPLGDVVSAGFGGMRAQAERRRALALRALDHKLNRWNLGSGNSQQQQNLLNPHLSHLGHARSISSNAAPGRASATAPGSSSSTSSSSSGAIHEDVEIVQIPAALEVVPAAGGSRSRSRSGSSMDPVAAAPAVDLQRPNRAILPPKRPDA